MMFREVERLVFSFKTLAKISNLDGLHNLTKLQLDNNRISRIENINHLVCCDATLLNLVCCDATLLRHTSHQPLSLSQVPSQ